MQKKARGRISAVIVTLVALIVLGAGFYLQIGGVPGLQQLIADIAPAPASSAAPSPAAPNNAAKVLYYKDPMGSPDVSPVPKKDSMGMEYIPVYSDEGATLPSTPGAPVASGKGNILYYRNPLGLPDVSPTPKKDSMGMDYIPVYENEGGSSDGTTVKISLDKVQKLGVMSEPAAMRRLTRAINAVGSVQLDESRQVIVSSKFEGWVEKLNVTKTGAMVKRGDPMLEIFSPTLRLAESQYLSTIETNPDLTRNALDRLRNQGMSDEQIAGISDKKIPPRTVTIFAPADGQIVEKPVIMGMRVEAGDPLYKLVDLSHVWVVAEIHERDLPLIRDGLPVTISFDAYPGESFAGATSLIYPMVNMETRTAQVRIELDNADGRLKPGMFANVAISADLTVAEGISVPDSAILDDGQHQTVLVDRGEGKFEPRAVKIGNRADGYVAILGGLKAGEKVVVSANFLIDAESNLQAALRAFMAKTPEPDAPQAEVQP